MKINIRRILSLALTLAFCASLCMPVFAINSLEITFSASCDNGILNSSDSVQTVNVTVTTNQGVSMDGFGAKIYCPEGWSVTAVTSSDFTYTESDLLLAYNTIAFTSPTLQNLTDVDQLAVITYSIPAGADVGTYTLGLYEMELTADRASIWENSATASATLTIVDSSTNNYVASLNCADTDLNVGEQLTVNVAVTGAGYADFASSEIILTYDSTKLTFNKTASNLNGATIPEQINGTIKLEDYGQTQSFGNAYTLVFDSIAEGNAEVKLTSAKFSTYANAASDNLVEATLSNATINATLTQMYSVSLDTAMFTGNAFVKKGDAYTFTAKDYNNYTYVVTATMGGSNKDVIDNGDGTYTISNVTGDLVISGTQTPKSHTVTFAGSGANDVTNKVTTATYGTPYTFTMPSATGYAYSAVITYTDTETTVDYSKDESGLVTIAGDKITGPITITITKTQTDANMSVVGSGASDVTLPDRATPGTDLVFAVTKDDRYDYTVSVAVNGTTVEFTVDDDGKYRIAGSSFQKGDNISISVEKTVKTDNVTVSKYVTVDESEMWLITVNTTKMDGSVYTYKNENMYWSEKYNNQNGAYCYLVVAAEQPTVTTSDLAIVTGAATEVDYDMDVNMTDKVDANDAQLAYNMYKAYYTDFSADVTMEEFLRADVNYDGKIDMSDPQAIIASLLS